MSIVLIKAFFVLNEDLSCHTWVIISLKDSYFSTLGVLVLLINMWYIHLKDKNQVLLLLFFSQSAFENQLPLPPCPPSRGKSPNPPQSTTPSLQPLPCVCVCVCGFTCVLHGAGVRPSLLFLLFLQAAGAVHRLSTVSLTAGDHRRPALPKLILLLSLLPPLCLPVLLPSSLPAVRWDLNHDVFFRPATQRCPLSRQAGVRPGVRCWKNKKWIEEREKGREKQGRAAREIEIWKTHDCWYNGLRLAFQETVNLHESEQ